MAETRQQRNARLAAEQHDSTERFKGSYQYGVRILPLGRIDVQPTKAIAESLARDWVISPLRTGPRMAQTVRRRGWGSEWETLDTWSTPESMEIVQ